VPEILWQRQILGGSGLALLVEILLYQGIWGKFRSLDNDFDTFALKELPGLLTQLGGDDMGNSLPVEPGRENSRFEIGWGRLNLVDDEIIFDCDEAKLTALAELLRKFAILHGYGKY
jgi:hypothetical protein